MTLAIFVEYQDPQSKELKTKIWPAGFENYRSKLWGSPYLRRLNLRLLPQIENDVGIRAGEFEELLTECDKLETYVKTAPRAPPRKSGFGPGFFKWIMQLPFFVRFSYPS